MNRQGNHVEHEFELLPLNAPQQLVEYGAVAQLDADTDFAFLPNDVASVRGVTSTQPDPKRFPSFEEVPLNIHEQEWLQLEGGTAVIPALEKKTGSGPSPWEGALLRRLIEFDSSQNDRESDVTDIPGASWRLSGGSATIHEVAIDGWRAAQRWQEYADRDFANSAYYMGTKKALLPTIMLCSELWMPKGSLLLDLMCGSGIVAGAFAQLQTTAASDALEFCRLLAQVQGSGFSRTRAIKLITNAKPIIRNQLLHLESIVGEVSSRERNIFRLVDSSSLAREYAAFVDAFPELALTGFGARGNSPPEEDRRPLEGLIFTSYYANMFFGVQQAMEIDSIRFAIDTIEDPVDRSWALGALVASVSRIGTTYAGHFAQPPAPVKELLRPNQVQNVINKRTVSVVREFEQRLLALATASESARGTVIPVNGPWQVALREAATTLDDRFVVYVDPPYGRDEYSRYYHVLETLVRYDYPLVSGAANVPLKRSYRFASEFHTRNQDAMRDRIVDVLGTVLAGGHPCLWSYSDAASVSAAEILEGLSGKFSSARSVAALHSHSRQGPRRLRQSQRKGALKVTEYLIYLEP